MVTNIHVVRSPDDPWLLPGYEVLNNYFGERGEMETLEVIRMRLGWGAKQPSDEYSFLYEMVVLTDEREQIIALRDHTVIVKKQCAADAERAAVVHLSHLFITEENRGKNKDFLSDECPEKAAGELLSRLGFDNDMPIILAAEVEHLQPGNEEREKRLRIFRGLQYKPIDPRRVSYLQPDFRSPDEIDAGGKAQPLPLLLLIKQLKNQQLDELSADEVIHIVTCLYRMYERGMKAEHMQCVYDSLAQYQTGTMPISLLWENTGLKG